MFADVLRGLRQEFINDFAEQANVSTRIAANPRDQVCYSVLILALSLVKIIGRVERHEP